MSTIEARSIKDEATETGRTTFKLPVGLWQMIERVADFQDLTWREWMSKVTSEFHSGDQVISKAKFIRQHAELDYDQMFEQQMMEDWKKAQFATSDDLADMEGYRTGPSHVRVLSLSEKEYADRAPMIESDYQWDFDVFVIHVGKWAGNQAVIVESKLKGGPSCVITDRRDEEVPTT